MDAKEIKRWAKALNCPTELIESTVKSWGEEHAVTILEDLKRQKAAKAVKSGNAAEGFEVGYKSVTVAKKQAGVYRDPFFGTEVYPEPTKPEVKTVRDPFWRTLVVEKKEVKPETEMDPFWHVQVRKK